MKYKKSELENRNLLNCDQMLQKIGIMEKISH